MVTMKTVKKPMGGYKGARDSDGVAKPTTPRMLLDARKAELALLEIRKLKGELVSVAEVQHARQSDAEVISNDLTRVLPSVIAGHAVALGCDQLALREVVRQECAAMLSRWAQKGGPL